MAVVMRMRWAGLTPDQYDAVRERVDWETEQPDGGYLHVAWFEGGDLYVWDVWESAEHFQQFTENRLLAGVAAAGITSQPDVVIDDCHAFQRELVIGGRLLLELGQIPSADAYEALGAKIDWRGRPPVGGICHIAARQADGSISTLTVWRSAAACVRFGVDRVSSAAASLGMPLEIDGNPPALHQVHAVYAPVTAPSRS